MVSLGSLDTIDFKTFGACLPLAPFFKMSQFYCLCLDIPLSSVLTRRNLHCQIGLMVRHVAGLAQLCKSQGASCSAFKLGSAPQYHAHTMQAIASLKFSQSRKINATNILEGIRTFLLSRCLEHKPTRSYSIFHPDLPIKGLKAQVVDKLIFSVLKCVPSYDGDAWRDTCYFFNVY